MYDIAQAPFPLNLSQNNLNNVVLVYNVVIHTITQLSRSPLARSSQQTLGLSIVLQQDHTFQNIVRNWQWLISGCMMATDVVGAISGTFFPTNNHISDSIYLSQTVSSSGLEFHETDKEMSKFLPIWYCMLLGRHHCSLDVRAVCGYNTPINTCHIEKHAGPTQWKGRNKWRENVNKDHAGTVFLKLLIRNFCWANLFAK